MRALTPEVADFHSIATAAYTEFPPLRVKRVISIGGPPGHCWAFASAELLLGGYSQGRQIYAVLIRIMEHLLLEENTEERKTIEGEQYFSPEADYLRRGLD